jgi:transcriptional regulator with XRE-family HTH domain
VKRNKALLLVIGTNIKRAREAKGFSQEALAARAKCHSNYVSRTEAGQIDVSVSGLFALAKGLNIDPCALLKE